ncbi:hypothetical protein EMIT0215P_10210 [Pseudomonas serboccidentalis]
MFLSIQDSSVPFLRRHALTVNGLEHFCLSAAEVFLCTLILMFLVSVFCVFLVVRV